MCPSWLKKIISSSLFSAECPPLHPFLIVGPCWEWHEIQVLQLELRPRSFRIFTKNLRNTLSSFLNEYDKNSCNLAFCEIKKVSKFLQKKVSFPPYFATGERCLATRQSGPEAQPYSAIVLPRLLPGGARDIFLDSRQSDNTKTTTRQRNLASETRRNTKSVKAWMSKWSSQNKYRQNDIINRFFGLKMWSRCRGSVVACPALQKGGCRQGVVRSKHVQRDK